MSVENTVLQFSLDPQSVTQDDLIEVLKQADDQYYNGSGESFLPDPTYDKMRRFAEKLDPTHPYFTGVGSDVRGGKIKLPFQMGSLDQVYEGETMKWALNLGLDEDTKVTVSNKLDGTSAMIIYDEEGNLNIAYSRGNGIEGADITRHVKKIPSVPKSVKSNGKRLVVRGEMIINRHRFKDIQQKVTSRNGRPYKNPRNMTAGLMNASKNPDIVYDYIEFVAYDIIRPSDISKHAQFETLYKLGFTVAYSTYFAVKDLTDKKLTAHLAEQRDSYPYEIDGVVIDVDSWKMRQRINPTRETLNPAYAVKYKVADESNVAIADVESVIWTASKHAYLKPRVKITPVELVGVTVTYATGFNAKFIKDNNIGPGARVQITRSGDVIPFIQKVVEPAPEPQMPEEEFMWNETGVDAILLDHGEEVDVRKIIDFFATIEVPHFGEGNVRKLYEAGYKTIEDMIMIDDVTALALLGKNGLKIVEGIEDKLTDVPLYKLMGALPFFGRGVGVRKFKKLQAAFGTEDLHKGLTVEEICSVEGFEEKTAQKIVAGYEDYFDFIDAVREGFDLSIAEDEVADGDMVGQKIVFTGFRDRNLQAQIEAAGGEVQSGVSSKTTLVVAANPNSNSGKVKKAREKGVKIVGIDEFKDML